MIYLHSLDVWVSAAHLFMQSFIYKEVQTINLVVVGHCLYEVIRMPKMPIHCFFKAGETDKYAANRLRRCGSTETHS